MRLVLDSSSSQQLFCVNTIVMREGEVWLLSCLPENYCFRRKKLSLQFPLSGQ